MPGSQVGDDLVGGPTGGGDAGRDADPVVGGARDGEARAAPRRPPDAGDPVQVADVVLGQAAAPAGDPVRDRRAVIPIDFGQFGGGEGGEVVVVALQDRDVAAAADRAADDVHRVPGSAALARCGHLTVENVAALTARPSTAGTR